MRIIENASDAKSDEITGRDYDHANGRWVIYAWVPGGAWVPAPRRTSLASK